MQVFSCVYTCSVSAFLDVTISRQHKAFSFMILHVLPALSFGDTFCMSRNMGGNSMAMSGLNSEKNLDWCWVGCFSLPMHKQAEKTALLPPLLW